MSTVKLQWSTPNGEQMIADMARVSAPENQGKSADKLLAYCIRNQHWSIFEMANVCFEIETTRDIARQILRHRSFSFQEFSQRYAEVDKLPKAGFREARMQDHKNRQNSIETSDKQLQNRWEMWQDRVEDEAQLAYKWALEQGIAKEVARAVLPEGLTTSRLFMNGTVRSWMHYCKLRTHEGTQKEHREVALKVSSEMGKLFPVAWNTLMEAV